LTIGSTELPQDGHIAARIWAASGMAITFLSSSTLRRTPSRDTTVPQPLGWGIVIEVPAATLDRWTNQGGGFRI
jgi:hypothetical protein